MALLNPFAKPGSPLLDAKVATLRYPQSTDYEAWARLRDISRDHLQPWEPTWGPDELSKTAYRRRMTRYSQDIRDDRGYAFWIILPDGRLAGGCTLTNVRRGVAQAASLGYWTGAPFAGKGLMTAAVQAVLGHCFTALNFHRVEAACLPSNAASKRVLEKCGFREEGYAVKYLKIDGTWHDHLLFAILEDDWRAAQKG
ncbi:MAG TPA: 30S ribosomal protein S5 alanine N-acetyltransferase [Alphaproteobacteria bacterium]|nr:30S ribosomal protein S5 alanine N-acetyltransferase [Alphaproteobacteria bacterium]HAJ48102.1 30S ribosomal protein S5 alanine N-acetyltransferase [Alphaproteobacteria bacterium]